jgi:hypothetical protein
MLQFILTYSPGLRLSLRNFFVIASPGYPDPHVLVLTASGQFLLSGKIQSFKTLSLATLAQMDAADTQLNSKKKAQCLEI